MKLRVVVEPDEDVYVAYCPELPGCVTYGKTEEEARKNILEAVELYLRPSKEELAKDAKVYEVAV
jgi:predicted RNase H-like HicB family nuclease